MRSKEEAFDYRYFPEPDLVPLDPDRALAPEVASALGPMPAERQRRCVEDAARGRGRPAAQTTRS